MKCNCCASFLQPLTLLLELIAGNFAIPEKYTDGIGPVGVSVQGSPNAVCPFTRYSLAALLCGNHVWSVRWNTVVYWPGYHGFPENSFTKTNWHTRCTLFWCAYEHMVIHGPNMPKCLSGGDTWLSWIWSVTGVFCFHIPFLQAIYRRLVYMDMCWHAALRQCRQQLPAVIVVLLYVHVSFLQMV